MTDRTSILFVCLGNICRSPLAEGVFLHLANERGVADRFRVDSAGLGDWHAGQPADPRARAVAEAHGVVLPSRARLVVPDELTRTDHVVCMDENNYEALLELGAPPEATRLLLEWDPRATLREVPDPYQGVDEDFRTVYRLVHGACDAMLDDLVGARSR